MIALNEKIKLEIEQELVRKGIKNPKWINGFAFNRCYTEGEISEFFKGQVNVSGINCYYVAGILKGENVYGQYIPTNSDGTLDFNSLRENHTPQLNDGEGK